MVDHPANEQCKACGLPDHPHQTCGQANMTDAEVSIPSKLMNILESKVVWKCSAEGPHWMCEHTLAEVTHLRQQITRLQEANETEVNRRRAAERKAEGYRLTVEAQAEKLATGGRPVRVAIADFLEARATKVDEETAGEEESFFKGVLTTSDLRDWASLLRQVDAQACQSQPDITESRGELPVTGGPEK